MKSISEEEERTQRRRRILLIEELLKEDIKRYKGKQIPGDVNVRKKILKELLARRPARYAKAEFFIIQNRYLREELERKGIVDETFIPPYKENLCLWKGDITALACDVIVNSAAPDLLGPFDLEFPGVDLEIHTSDGVQLRYECNEIIKMKKRNLFAGEAIMTTAHNLPCKFIMHTVAPQLFGEATQEKLLLLGKCYTACLERAAQNENIKSIAFCCLGTGNNGFPKEKAAWSAIAHVHNYLVKHEDRFKVIFCVHNDEDFAIYQEFLNRLD